MGQWLKGMGYFAMVMLVAALSACVSTNPEPGLKLNPGATLAINSSFEIPQQFARVYFQAGSQFSDAGDLDKSETYCSLLMNRVQLPGTPQMRVLPGEFAITRVRKFNDRYAMPGVYDLKDMFLDPPSDVIYEIEMRLQSAEQPEVRALICRNHVNGYRELYPRLGEIRLALGSLVTLSD